MAVITWDPIWKMPLDPFSPTQQRLDNQCLEYKTTPKCLLPGFSYGK